MLDYSESAYPDYSRIPANKSLHPTLNSVATSLCSRDGAISGFSTIALGAVELYVSQEYMMLRLMVISLFVSMVACEKKESYSSPKTLVKFEISIEEFLRNPPAEFEQLPFADQEALRSILGRDNPNHGTQILFHKFKTGDELHLAISIFESRVRNGRRMVSGPMYGLKKEGSAWEIDSIATD